MASDAVRSNDGRSPMREPQMTIDSVSTGRFFVNEKKGLVREITSDTGDGNVHWRSYDLADGRPTGDALMCSKYRIIQWADREATAAEVAIMQCYDARTLEMERIMKFVNNVLANAPDEVLLDEIRRRGYDIVRR